MRWSPRARWPAALHRFSRPPIVIGGCGRSGTTLLASVLSCHPRLSVIGPETRAFARGAYPADEPPRDRPFDLETLTPHLEAAPAGAERWAEKTPRNVHAFERISAFFGGRVHLVLVVRDGRDVVCSFHPDDPRQPWISPERWVEDTRAGLAVREHLDVHTVRYEDLVQRFEPTMRTLAAAIGEPDPEPLLRYPAGATLVEHAAWSDGARPVSGASVGRWQRPALLGYAQALLRHPDAPGLLEACGYTVGASGGRAPPPWTSGLEDLPAPRPAARAARALTRELGRRHRHRARSALRGPLSRWARGAGTRDGDARPIFLVGPRCAGVDTIASLLHAHPELFVLPEDARVLERVSADAAPEAYRRLARRAGLGASTRWVGCGPALLDEAPTLRAIFPRARFLVVTRPESQVVHGLAGRLGDRWAAEREVQASLQLAREVATWPEAMHAPEPALLEDPEATLRRILRFLDLPWAPNLVTALETATPHLERLRRAAAEVP